ncbi:Co2+/Mg2+ efflux protein ApaG [Calidithermus roseus]|uniref:Protein ApaG n=1 Tax=Calidithermus roseus TaxID=1644118 RepID=A0A399EV12_9DEIN|nr:Co2+/Mg2+ efflux protein ApaG [Calidithermus roseus]RIH86051.1 Protein ApaG [Calidithermus roseus]
MNEELPIREDIRVEVEVLYAYQHSRPGEHIFVYFITITNQGKQTVQLLSRHWVITQAVGQPEEVIGPGVVGEQPVLEPGESFSYNSFCPIARPPGQMRGWYTFQNILGQRFRVAIPPFDLRLPQRHLN